MDQLYKIAGPDFKNVTAIAGHLRFRSCRVVQKALEIWSSALTGEEKELWTNFQRGLFILIVMTLFQI